jgi:hypothetical protein
MNLLFRDRRPRVPKRNLYPDEGLEFLTTRERAIWRAATRQMRGGSTTAAFYAANLVFATGTAVHTNLNVLPPSQHGLSLVEFGISFDGVTASAVPVLVEIGTGTQAGAGTGAASPPTVVQVRGRATTGTVPTLIHNCTVEPTAQTVLRQWLVSPNGGLFVYPLPLGREIECDSSGGTAKALFARVTSAATVNSRCYMEVENL